MALRAAETVQSGEKESSRWFDFSLRQCHPAPLQHTKTFGSQPVLPISYSSFCYPFSPKIAQLHFVFLSLSFDFLLPPPHFIPAHVPGRGDKIYMPWRDDSWLHCLSHRNIFYNLSHMPDTPETQSSSPGIEAAYHFSGSTEWLREAWWSHRVIIISIRLPHIVTYSKYIHPFFSQITTGCGLLSSLLPLSSTECIFQMFWCKCLQHVTDKREEPAGDRSQNLLEE